MGILEEMPRRITEDLEPLLLLPDPRTKLSVYHDMPYAIFHYSPEEEFALRFDDDEVSSLRTVGDFIASIESRRSKAA